MNNTETTQETTLLDQKNLSIVYDCLNGKSHSCIHGRDIGVDKIRCALRKAFGERPKEISDRLKAIAASKEEKQEADLSLEYDTRYNIIKKIKKKFDIEIPFEKRAGFYKGSEVLISPDSKYSHQNKGKGILQENYKTRDEEEHVKVTFENGYSNSYRKKDLVLIGKESSKDDIYKKISEESRETFINRITDIVTKKIESDQSLLKIYFPEAIEFEEGENIVMNHKANENYSITKEGSRGVVLKKLSGDIYLVKYSYVSTDRDLGEWEVASSTMTSLDEKPTKEEEPKTYDEIYEKIAEYITKKTHKIEEKLNEVSDHIDSDKQLFQDLGTKELLKNNIFIPLNEDNEYALNFGNITQFVAPKLHEIYSNPELYSSGVTVGPPAERLPNVLKLELTNGCNHSQCTYCDRYHGVRHNKKTAEEFIKHTDSVIESLNGYKSEITRVFLGAGNGLEVDQDTLKKALVHVDKRLSPQRISIYGNTKAILNKSVDELRELERKGLKCIYRGIESGSDEVLRYVRKGCTTQEMIDAGAKVNKTEIDLSVMIMPGLGGERLSKEHIDGTIKLLNDIKVKYITFMAINPTDKSLYKRIMDKENSEGKNRELSDLEVVQQVRAILKGLNPRGQKIGMYGKEIDMVGANPISLKAEFNREGKEDLLYICDEYIRTHKK